MLALFEQDPETELVMMIGEIGGPQEADAALFVKERMTKPVVGYVAGLTAPKGRRMGHAGAIISAFGDTAAEKAEIMRSGGAGRWRRALPSSGRPWLGPRPTTVPAGDGRSGERGALRPRDRGRHASAPGGRWKTSWRGSSTPG